MPIKGIDSKTLVVLIFFLGLAVYGRILGNGFVGDDPGYINHPYIQQLQLTKLFSGSSTDLGGNSPITGNFYRPVMLVVLAQIFAMAGKSAWVYHLVQLGLHIANSILVYLFLRKFFGQVKAGILSLVFLVHPINTETVVYISNLQDVLYVFFGLTAMILFVYRKYLWMIPVTLMLSMLSKETGVLFVIAGLAYVWFVGAKNIVQIVKWLIVTLFVYFGLRFGIASVGMGGISDTIMGNLSLAERLIQVPAIIWYYLKTFVWPMKLAIGQTWLAIPGDSLIMLIPVITVIFITFISTIKKQSKTAAFFGFWIAAGLAMHLQIIPLEMTVADRWMYFVMIGVVGLLANFWPKRRLLLLVWVVPLLALRSFVRAGDFRTALGLYTHDSKITSSYMLEHSLGYELMQLNRMAEAKFHFDKSIKLFGNTLNTNSLGVWYFRQGENHKAIDWFEKSISLGDNFQAYNNLSRIQLDQKDFVTAQDTIQEGIKKFPQSDNFWFLLAIAQYLEGNNLEALKAARNAVEISPSQQNVYVLNQLQSGEEIKIND